MQPELVRMVAERAGVPEDKAEKAAETVIGYLKDKLPAGVSKQLDSIAAGDRLSDLAKGLGGKLPGRE